VCSALQKIGGAKNYIVIPLQYKGGLVGALFVANPREEVTEEDLTMLQNFAWPASQAIRNAHLYTKTKRAQEQLRESEENLKAYLDNAPDGVYIHDLKGNFLYGNKKAEEILGYEREELIGKGFLKLNILPAKYLAKAGELLALNAAGKPNGPDEFELTRKDGSPRWVEISTAPIKQGGETVVIGFVRDITDHKKAKKAQQESEARYRALVHLEGRVGEAVVMLHNVGQREGVQIFFNEAWPQITGYSESELRNISFQELLHPKYREAFLARHRRRVHGESISGLFEMTIIRKDGTESY
jgi:PAS domain S-box-containing protein